MDDCNGKAQTVNDQVSLQKSNCFFFKNKAFAKRQKFILN
jgi:hypothetical protein